VQRQADNIGQRTPVIRHDQLALLLNRVAAGLVQRVHPREVGLDGRVVERLEGHLGRLPRVHAHPGRRVAPRQAGEHRVRPPRQPPQHRPRLRGVGRFVQRVPFYIYRGVRAQHPRVRPTRRHPVRLERRVVRHHFARIGGRLLVLDHVGRDDLERHAPPAEPFTAAGRGGGENERHDAVRSGNPPPPHHRHRPGRKRSRHNGHCHRPAPCPSLAPPPCASDWPSSTPPSATSPPTAAASSPPTHNSSPPAPNWSSSPSSPSAATRPAISSSRAASCPTSRPRSPRSPRPPATCPRSSAPSPAPPPRSAAPSSTPPPGAAAAASNASPPSASCPPTTSSTRTATSSPPPPRPSSTSTACASA